MWIEESQICHVKESSNDCLYEKSDDKSDPVGWDIFNFVKFANLIYMKLYSLLILTKNTKKVKKRF